MRRAVLIGALTGALAAAILGFVDYRQDVRRTAEAEEEAGQLERELEPLHRHREIVSEFEALLQERSRASDIVKTLEVDRIDPSAFDLAVQQAVQRADVHLEVAKWTPDGVFVTFRATETEEMVVFAEALAAHPAITSVEIKRWSDEEEPDRFVVRARWVGFEEGGD